MSRLDWLTPTDLERARQLARVRLQLQAVNDELSRRHKKLCAHFAAHDAARTARLDFRRQPDLLAGLAEMLQRNHATHHQLIERMYRHFLREMINPFPSLHGPTPRPRRVDFAALPLAARPYLIGPYLGIQQNDRFAEIDLRQSRPSEGRMVIMQTGGPVDIELWRSRMADLNAWLCHGDSHGTWTIVAHTGSTLTLARRTKLPAVISFNRRFLSRGALFAGIDVVARRPLLITFADLSAGTYIPGASGSGKTSALHILLRSVFANLELFSAVYLVDGKDGVAMSRYAHLHPKIRVLYEEPDVWKLAADLNVVMRQRNAQQRARGVEKAIRGFIGVVVDELPTFVAKPVGDAKKEHAVFLDNLQKIAMRGRSAGIRMFFISQSPVAEQIPVALRTNCATTIAFRLPETAHATAIFGTLSSANDPRKLPTGQAIVLQADAGTTTTVQFPLAPLYQPRRSP